MKYDAVTLDTNIFVQKRLNLERGMLAQFKQFAEGSVKFILSEIILKEMFRHLKSDADDAKHALEAAIRHSAITKLFDAKTMETLSSLASGILDPSEAANRALMNWLGRTGCEVVNASGANVERLIEMYFATDAPFEKSKKHEFPDAIALITLEDWAKTKGQKLLAITRDEGWIAFCEKSEWIDAETDVSSALQRFQAHTESARKLVASLLNLIATGKRQDVMTELKQRLDKEILNVEPEVEADSDFYWVETSFNIRLREIHLHEPTNSFRIIQTQKDAVVARIIVGFDALVEIDFDYYGNALRERKIGDSTERVDCEFSAPIIITIRGDDPNNCTVVDMELDDDASVQVDFGNIGPDFPDYEE